MPLLRTFLRPLSRTSTAAAPRFGQCRALTKLPPKNRMPPRPKVNEADLEEKFVKGTGPGGQKINKTDSACQLRHIPTGIVVKSQETRSREQNRKIARRLLAEKLEEMEKGEESRAAIVRLVKSTRKASAEKKKRRKYRRLAGEEGRGVDGEEEEGEDDEEWEEDEEDEGIRERACAKCAGSEKGKMEMEISKVDARCDLCGVPLKGKPLYWVPIPGSELPMEEDSETPSTQPSEPIDTTKI